MKNENIIWDRDNSYPIKRSFTMKRFGFVFVIYLNGTSTAARIIKHNNFKLPRELQTVGSAVLKHPDEYNLKIGINWAIKVAMNKFNSISLGKMKKLVKGYESKMSKINEQLVKEIELLQDK